MAAYPKEYVPCRAIQHLWRESTPAPGEFKRPEFGFRWFQRCEGCGGWRWRICSRMTGEYVDRHWSYRMPVDFKSSKPGMTRADYRRMYFRQERKHRNSRA